ncbi:MAG TPA: 4Fe-4S binding protein [Acidobacteriaceae bacterium]|jgi:polyferredoxin
MLTESATPIAVVSTTRPAARQKKPLVRRTARDRSQQVRRVVQFAFLALNAWIAIEFLLWTRYFETAGRTHYFERPAGVDGWLPIAGLMNLKYFLVTHQVPSMHPAAMVLAAVFLLSSLLLKKTFCSWLCPVGTASEYLWKLGRKVFRRNFEVPRWLDIPLRGLKYVLLAFFLFIVVSMTVNALNDFMLAPFGIVADVKMLNFFREMSLTGVAVIAALMLLSVFVKNFWCRFLCPYGALMGLVGTLSPVRIRRDSQACIDCGKCNKACPANLPVDKLVQIQSLECTSCMECVAACPAENALQLSLLPRKNDSAAERWRNRVLQPRMVAAMLALIFFGLIGVARATGHWQTNIPRDVYMQLVPHADEYGHQESLN